MLRTIRDGSAAIMSLGVSGLAIKGSKTNDTVTANEWAPVMWAAADLLAATNQPRDTSDGNNDSHHFTCTGAAAAALLLLDINFNDNFSFGFGQNDHTTAPIIGLLTTKYPALVHSLQALNIEYNNHNESFELGAFAVLATQLRALTFRCCGLTSVKGLEGNCGYLQKANLYGCRRLKTTDGLQGHTRLQVVDVSHSAVQSLRALRDCPALTTVAVSCCHHLHSLDGLEDHRSLRAVDAGNTPIVSLEALRSCPALRQVIVHSCQKLASLDGLEYHALLEEVDASRTPITSVEALLTGCRSLTTLSLVYCPQLPAHAVLPPIVNLKR